jgi:hypothetical protein
VGGVDRCVDLERFYRIKSESAVGREDKREEARRLTSSDRGQLGLND